MKLTVETRGEGLSLIPTLFLMMVQQQGCFCALLPFSLLTSAKLCIYTWSSSLELNACILSGLKMFVFGMLMCSVFHVSSPRQQLSLLLLLCLKLGLQLHRHDLNITRLLPRIVFASLCCRAECVHQHSICDASFFFMSKVWSGQFKLNLYWLSFSQNRCSTFPSPL